MTLGAVDADLGVALPAPEPSSLRATAATWADLGERLLAVSRGVAGLLPVAGWSGVAAAACDQRLLDVAVAISAERDRVDRAAEALRDAAARLEVAEDLADEARRLLASAHEVQAHADAADPALAAARLSGQWSGARSDGTLYDPQAVALLRRARDRAAEARTTADAATRRLTAELTDLSGRRIRRDTGSWRTLLDVVGFVPGYGDAVDVANAAVYVAQGDLRDAALTGAAAVPGPLGWAAGARKVDNALDTVGDITRVVENPSRARAVEALNGLTVHGRGWAVRHLPDDRAIERFYRDVLQPLGTTTTRQTQTGVTMHVTDLPGGGRVVLREGSNSGGYAIDVVLDEVPFKRIHRAE